MTDITLPRAELKRALEALEQMYKRAASPDTLEASDRDLQNIADNPMSGEVALEAQEVLFIRAAITALRDRLAQPEQERNVWRWYDLSLNDIKSAIEAKLKEKNT